MKFVRFFPLVLIFVSLAWTGYARKEFHEIDSLYYILDQGDIKNGLSLAARSREDLEVRYFTAEEAVGYTLFGRNILAKIPRAIYFSRVIPIADSMKQVFLRRIREGELTFYDFKSADGTRYFIEDSGGSLTEISSSDYREKLKTLTADFPALTDPIRLTRFKQDAVNSLVGRYNRRDRRPFPFTKFGILAGMEWARLEYMESRTPLTDVQFSYKPAFVAGAFVDVPLFYTDFSLHVEAMYSHHVYSSYFLHGANTGEFIAKTSELQAPLLLRYTLPFPRFRPYVELGGTYAHLFEGECQYYYQEKRLDETYDTMPVTQNPIAKNYVGYSVGTGIEYKLNYKKSLFLQIRYSYLDNMSNRGTVFNHSIIHLVTGLNFKSR